jgi:hypothetical protein
MAKCLPNMPCYGGEVKIYTTYPRGCTSSQSSPYTFPISSDNLSYTGPNLPYTGIQTDMDLTEALQRIDVQLNPEIIFELFMTAIEQNPSLFTQLCEKLAECP